MLPDMNLGLTQDIIAECRRQELDNRDTSYVLSTAFWESGRTMEPVREAFYLGKKAEAYRKKLRYYPYYGRGLVQLTWEYNYAKAGKILGVNFVKNPDLVMEPKYSVFILVTGMKEGWFTGKKLSDYKTHYSARAIVNGDKDKIVDGEKLGVKLEKIARDYFDALSDNPTGVVRHNEPAVEDTRNIWQLLLSIILKLLGVK